MPDVRNQVSGADHPVLVVGAGVAGLSAALELSRAGIRSLVVDRAPFPGGHGAVLACKATDRCLQCHDCLAEDLFREVAERRSFDLRAATRVTRIERTPDGFRASLRSLPPVIDPERCTCCGECLKALPAGAEGAIRRAPSIHLEPLIAVDPEKWPELDEDLRLRIQAACPENAIRSLPPEEEWTWEGRGVILAAGFEPFDPSEKPAYGYGRFDNMITTLELERMLRRTGRIRRVSDGKAPRKVAFVQCVGSRDAALGHEFCSRICCGVALRMGLHLVHGDPDMDVAVFYMDIQNFGKDFERYCREARDTLRLVRGLPGDAYAAENGRISLSRYDETEGGTVTEDFDLVVLSVGMMPAPAASFFVDRLGLTTNEDGFPSLPEGGPEDVCLAGAFEGPLDVAESIAGGKAAAWRMSGYLGGRRSEVRGEKHP